MTGKNFREEGTTMKKSYLAAAAILGAGIFAGQAHAAKIDLGDGKSFIFGFRGKINATYQGKRNDTDKADLYLSVPDTRIYAKGSISKIFKWGWQAELSRNAGNNMEIIDAFVLLDFAKEFKLMAGAYKLPFQLNSGIYMGWSLLMPVGIGSVLRVNDAARRNNNPFANPAAERMPRSGSRSPQITAWGKVADGLFKYYLTLVDMRDETSANQAKTGYGVRVEFAPVMAGYKGHPGYVLKETYLGKQNTLALGLSYFTQKTGNANNKSLGVDLMWEQNLGAITPNLQIGYVDHKDFRGVQNDDRKGLLVQGQVLFNQKTMLGKPAVTVRWAQSDPNIANGGNKESTLGVAGQLYVKGVGNRISLAVDQVKNDAPGTKDYTDITLALWYFF